MNIWELEPHKITKSLKDKIISFYGGNSTRKTSIAACFPGSLVFGWEKGWQCIDGVYAIDVDSWSKFKDWLRQLKDPRAKAKYQTLVLDNTRIMYDACLTYILNQYDKKDITEIGSKGKGWTILKKEFSDVLNSIPKMGYGLILITHSKEEEKDGKLVIKTDLDSVSTDIINKLVDFQLYVRKETNEQGELSVFAYSDLDFADTKHRLRYFPKRFEFTYENLIDAYNHAFEEEVKHGAELSDAVETKGAAEELDALRNEVIDLVMKDPENEAVVNYILNHFDKKLSETTDEDYDSLIAARDYLQGLYSEE